VQPRVGIATPHRNANAIGCTPRKTAHELPGISAEGRHRREISPPTASPSLGISQSLRNSPEKNPAAHATLIPSRAPPSAQNTHLRFLLFTPAFAVFPLQSSRHWLRLSRKLGSGKSVLPSVAITARTQAPRCPVTTTPRPPSLPSVRPCLCGLPFAVFATFCKKSPPSPIIPAHGSTRPASAQRLKTESLKTSRLPPGPSRRAP